MEGAICGYVVKKLGELLSQEISLLRQTEEDLEWMKGELGMMQALLDQYAITNEISDFRIKTWVEDVQNLAFQAEDIIDSFSASTQRYIRIGSFGFFVGPTSPSLFARHKFGVEVGKLRKKVYELTRRKTTYGIELLPMEPQNRERGRRLLEIRRTMAQHPAQDTDVLVGLKPHVEDVTKRLQGGEMQRLVIPVVGMGGLGKTTLAKKVYQKMKERSTFDCTAWVVVSQEYDCLQLLRIIAKQVMSFTSDHLHKMDKDELEEKLRQFLCQKRYLIVLDDVWETKVSDDFCSTFPDPGNRSRLVVTTRSLDVGRLVNLGGFSPYELPFLDEEAAWELFAKKVFSNEQNPEKCFTDELKRLGKEMVAKCNGLPLAIVILGGLLSSKDKSHSAWSKIADGTPWKEPTMKDGCMKILASSYRALPVHLRWCFMYLGIFPEDAVIDVSKLLRLWIGEGFIINIDGEDLEETAERYVEELIQRCLVQVVERNSYGVVLYICVHDLLLELAIAEAKSGRFLEVWKNAENVNLASNARRLVAREHSPFNRNLRSLFLCDVVVPHSLAFKNLNLLRVLDVKGHSIITEEVGLLVNLRYLRVEPSDTFTFPSSLGKLKHLQTLEILGWDTLILPSSLWEIKTLRHIIGNTSEVSGKAPIGDIILPNLRTLKGIIAGPWIKNILRRLNNLKELYVCDIDQEWMVESMSSAIQNLQQLNVLQLEGKALKGGNIPLSGNTHRHLYELAIRARGRNSSLLTADSSSREISCRRFPNLSKVELFDVLIRSNILKQLGSLQSLKELTLHWTVFEEEEDMVFEGGSFPQLRVLELKYLKINRWVLELPCLDNLSSLTILKCRNLEALPEGLQHIRTLECLHLIAMGSAFVKRNRGFIDGLHCKIDICL